MFDEKVTVKFDCKVCGGTILTLSDGEADDSTVTCKACGQVLGTWRDIKAKAQDDAKAILADRARDALKGFKGWKV
ncbi:hypothetical protein V5F77_02655 [Xanthobacter sp. DSM 24535]|uniref:ECs_2282 family putative zinc-binding protein n=1 Tax=Roseixanthobacter psychrophilus TaxID=3119917 RepID=UPI003729F0A5